MFCASLTGFWPMLAVLKIPGKCSFPVRQAMTFYYGFLKKAGEVASLEKAGIFTAVRYSHFIWLEMRENILSLAPLLTLSKRF